MVAYDDSSGQHAIASQTGFVLGSAARHTINFLVFPYWSIGKYAAVFASARVRSWIRRRAQTVSPDAPPKPLPAVAATRAQDDGLTEVARALIDPDPDVRLSAVDTIGEFSADRASAFIADLLHDPQPEIRCAAAEAAANTRSSAAVFTLILTLADPDATVRLAVRQAIETISGQQLDVDLSEPLGQATLQQLKSWWKGERMQLLIAQTEQ